MTKPFAFQKCFCWYIFLMVSLSLLCLVPSEASSSKYSRSVGRILNYFHPRYDVCDYAERENCTDLCVLNKRLLSEDLEKHERAECAKLHTRCTERDAKNPYRKIDGSCNNLKNPDWGAAGTCHQRFLPHDYGDGVSSPKKSCLKGNLPNARGLSNGLHKEIILKPLRHTLHFMEWGQIISHDTTFSPLPGLPEIGPGSCCFPHARVDDNCIATVVPDDDEFYPGRRKCLSIQRSLKCPLCTKGVRHSLNKNTAYFDLSIVYGNDDERAKALRSWKNGMLRTQHIPGVGDLLPAAETLDLCESQNSTHKCFLAGDERINQNVLLTSQQTILLRNHNNICRRLKIINPKWNDYRLFEEARKINIAQAQFITFNDYLKYVLGSKVTRDFHLDVLPGKKFTKYDPTLDASTFDEFGAAAQRYGHTMVPNTFLEKDPHSGCNKFIQGKDFFYYPFDFYNGQFDRLAMGMTRKIARWHDLLLSSSIRNFLYDKRNESEFHGSDLAAVTISRLRDHGMPSYVYYLKYFFNYDVQSFCDLKKFIPEFNVERHMKHYRSVFDVNLYSAILSEYHIDGGLVGPTNAAILLVQYSHMKFGDRYYFEHGSQAGSFTPEQLEEIKLKTSLARIICETTKISRIQPDVFLPPSKRNKVVPCHSLPGLDLSHWKEEKCET